MNSRVKLKSNCLYIAVGKKDSRTADDLLKEAKGFRREDRPSVHFNVPSQHGTYAYEYIMKQLRCVG